MNGGDERGRVANAPDGESTAGGEEPVSPYVVVRNGDEDDLTVAVSVSAVGERGPPVGARYRIEGDRERAVSLRGSSGDSLGDVLRIEVDAGIGASAQVSLDPAHLDGTEAPVPEFVVRDGRIAVSGLVTPVDGGESDPEVGLS